MFVFMIIFLCFNTPTSVNATPIESSFVWLTDIHLDPLYNPNASGKDWCRPGFDRLQWETEQRRHSPMMHSHTVPYGPTWRGGIGGQAQRPMTSELNPRFSQRTEKESLVLSAYWGRVGCDAPIQLVKHCFNNILNETISRLQRKVDPSTKPFIIVTGDLAAHYWDDHQKYYRWESLLILSSMLVELSEVLGTSYDELNNVAHSINGSSQLIITLGNNDLPEDYVMQEWDHWASKLYHLWTPHIVPPNSENQKTFQRGLYYWTLITSVPHLRALCLNTTWWSRNRLWPSKRPIDPVGQFEWLERQLNDAEINGDHVLILGHIPPGYSYFSDRAFTAEPQWFDEYEGAFLKLIGRYREIVVGQFFGHFHSDDLRIQRGIREYRRDEGIQESDKLKERESDVTNKQLLNVGDLIGAALLAPSIGTTHGNNPGWRLMHLQTTMGQMAEQDHCAKCNECAKCKECDKCEECDKCKECDKCNGTATKKDMHTETSDNPTGNNEGLSWSSVTHFVQRIWNRQKVQSNVTGSVQWKSILFDYDQYISHLHSSSPTDLGTYSSSLPPPFVKAYSFRELYSQSDVSYRSIDMALSQIQTSSQLFDLFWNYYDAEGGQPAAFFLRCVQTIVQFKSMERCMDSLVPISLSSNDALNETHDNFFEFIVTQ